MAFLIGAVLALTADFSATYLGLDRDRAFYPSVMIVIASYNQFQLLRASKASVFLTYTIRPHKRQTFL